MIFPHKLPWAREQVSLCNARKGASRIQQATQVSEHALPVQGQCQGTERAQPELLFPCWCSLVVAAWKHLLRCSVQTLPAQLLPSHGSLGVPVLQLTPSSQTLRWAQHLPCPPQGSGSAPALPRALLLKASALKPGSRRSINRTNLAAIPHLGDPSLPGH